MTRINVVLVTELCDQHLLAEFRELTRIPNCVKSGKLRHHYDDRPEKYVLGPGHVKFFTNKLGWLKVRYDQLYAECVRRGFRVTYIFPEDIEYPMEGTDWVPDPLAVSLNRARIHVRMPKKPRWTNAKQPNW